MQRTPRTVRPDDALQFVAQVLTEDRGRSVLVVDDARQVVGLVTERSIVEMAVARGADGRTLHARDVMTESSESVGEQVPVQEALRRMVHQNLRSIPVLGAAGKLAGVVTLAEIAREADVDPGLQSLFAAAAAERRFWSRLR